MLTKRLLILVEGMPDNLSDEVLRQIMEDGTFDDLRKQLIELLKQNVRSIVPQCSCMNDPTQMQFLDSTSDWLTGSPAAIYAGRSAQ